MHSIYFMIFACYEIGWFKFYDPLHRGEAAHNRPVSDAVLFGRERNAVRVQATGAGQDSTPDGKEMVMDEFFARVCALVLLLTMVTAVYIPTILKMIGGVCQ